ncbi:MAG: TIGR03085 family metal-binding protein [Actinoplanes sp.]
MTGYAKRERKSLADLLLRVGPDEPTLCEGWTTRDLAAHLVVRERRPDAMAAGLIKPLQGHGEQVRLAKAAEAYSAVVHEVRTPPWWSPVSNPLTDEAANGAEFFIHHEDVRRGRPGWQPRDLDPGQERALWRATRLSGRLILRRFGVPATVRADGYGSFTVGADPQVVLSGRPGELSLFLSGRQRAAQVDIEGPADLAERFRTEQLGL